MMMFVYTNYSSIPAPGLVSVEEVSTGVPHMCDGGASTVSIIIIGEEEDEKN